MSKPSSGTSGGDSRNWDQPDGLGWQVWRRARSTALLTQPTQRDLARLRSNILRDPAPLLTDIRRRWALGDSVVNRFSLSLPLFWVQRRAFHDGVSVEPAVSARLSPRHPGVTDLALSAIAPTVVRGKRIAPGDEDYGWRVDARAAEKSHGVGADGRELRRPAHRTKRSFLKASCDWIGEVVRHIQYSNAPKFAAAETDRRGCSTTSGGEYAGRRCSQASVDGKTCGSWAWRTQ